MNTILEAVRNASAEQKKAVVEAIKESVARSSDIAATFLAVGNDREAVKWTEYALRDQGIIVAILDGCTDLDATQTVMLDAFCALNAPSLLEREVIQ